jgi:hypothetical protein
MSKRSIENLCVVSFLFVYNVVFDCVCTCVHTRPNRSRENGNGGLIEIVLRHGERRGGEDAQSQPTIMVLILMRERHVTEIQNNFIVTAVVILIFYAFGIKRAFMGYNPIIYLIIMALRYRKEKEHYTYIHIDNIIY